MGSALSTTSVDLGIIKEVTSLTFTPLEPAPWTDTNSEPILDETTKSTNTRDCLPLILTPLQLVHGVSKFPHVKQQSFGKKLKGQHLVTSTDDTITSCDVKNFDTNKERSRSLPVSARTLGITRPPGVPLLQLGDRASTPVTHRMELNAKDSLHSTPRSGTIPSVY